jgi:alkyl hydroperoxide reductase subunit AhpC
MDQNQRNQKIKKKELGANNFSNFCLFAMLADFTFVCEFGLFSQY